MLKKIRWKFLLGVFKLKRIVGAWYGTRKLDYEKKNLRIFTHTIREYETRARSVQKEPHTVVWIEKHAGKGLVFYDVGANIGAYSLIAASLGMEVIAFEPAHHNVASLEENISLNNLDQRVTVVPFMLSGAAGVQRFSVSDTTSGSSHGFFNASPHAKKNEAGKALLSLSLDECVRLFSFPAPTILKVDVDGAEVEVLQGAEKTLKNISLASVLIEADHANASRVREILERAGFRCTREVAMDKKTANYIFDRT